MEGLGHRVRLCFGAGNTNFGTGQCPSGIATVMAMAKTCISGKASLGM